MLTRYSLRPDVDGEPDPVVLSVEVTADHANELELLLAIEGARNLRPVPGIDPEHAKIVERAGASFSRYLGVRLSNGFNVVDPPRWRGQGISTIAMNAIIEWARRRHPAAALRVVELKRYGTTILRTDPRLAFYGCFGLRWEDGAQASDAVDWISAPMRVADLLIAPLPRRLGRLP